MLRRSPVFVLTVVLTLALGIGANTAIFTVVNSVLLRPLAYRDASRLVAVWDTYPPRFSQLGLSPLEYDEMARQTDIFEEVGRYRHIPGGKEMNLTGGTEPLRVHATCVSSSLFPMLGVQPLLGRAFDRADDSPHPPAIAMLGFKLWRDYFGSNPNLIGAPIQLDGQAFTVVGVLPANFRLPDWADLWLPQGQAGDEITNPVRHAFGLIARLQPNATIEQASARLQSIAARLEHEHPQTSRGFGVKISGLQQDLAGNLRPALLVLLGAVTLVLLIACVNVANLLLSRAAARRREFAIRIALGAGRWRIVRQSLGESVQLSLAGGAAGLLLAYVGLKSLIRLLPADLMDPTAIHIDLTTLAFLLGTSLVTGIVFGTAPALQAARQDPNEGLKEGGRGLTRGAGAGRNALVIAEFALALVLLMGAGLLIRSFAVMLHVDPGFRPDHVLTLRFTMSPRTYPDTPKQHAFFERLQARVHALPGVKFVATSNALPVTSTRANLRRFSVPGSALINPDMLPIEMANLVTPEYFQTLGIPLIAGRTYTEHDLDQPYVIIDQTLAKTYWPGENPVGKRFITGPFGPNPSSSTIIGVVADIQQFGLDSEHTPDMYYLDYGSSYMLLKTAGDPLALAAAVRREIQAIDPAIPVSEFRTLEQVLDSAQGLRRFSTVLLSLFAGLAVTLAVIGIYGVMSWSVAQRTQEIGVRMAVGADARGVFLLVLGRGLRLGLVGLVIGLGATLALTRLLGALLFEISPHDPWILCGVSVLMILVTVGACFIPARRAAEVDPITALRAE